MIWHGLSRKWIHPNFPPLEDTPFIRLMDRSKPQDVYTPGKATVVILEHCDNKTKALQKTHMAQVAQAMQEKSVVLLGVNTPF